MQEPVTDDLPGPEASAALLAEARQLATNLGDSHVTAKLHLFVAEMEAKRGLLENARKHSAIARHILSSSPNIYLEAFCNNIDLAISVLLCRFADAQTFGARATELAEQCGVAAIYRAPTAGAPPAATAGLGLGTLTRSEWKLLLLGALPWLLYNASFQIMMSFMPSFFVDSGFELARAARLSAVSAIGFVIGVQAGGLLLKRSSQPDLICYAALAGWCVALLALSTGTAPLPWVLLGGLLGGLPAAALVSLPAEVLRPESRSAGMGIFFTVYYLGCAILPTVAGMLYDRAGGGAALWMAAGLALACIPILGGFRRGMKTAQFAPVASK